MFNNKTKGYVTYEKNGKTYFIKAKRFLRMGVKGFSRVKGFLGSRTISIIGKGVSNVHFMDCSFNLSKPERRLYRLYIEADSKDINIMIQKVDFEIVQDIIIKSNGSITIDDIRSNGNVIIEGNHVSAMSLKDLDLNIQGNEILVADYHTENDSSLTLSANNKIELQNVKVETLNQIAISTPKIEYNNISLTSGKIRIGNFFNTNSMPEDVYTINDDTLNYLNSINNLQSILKGVHKKVKYDIVVEAKTAICENQRDVIHRIEEIEEEKERLIKLAETIAKNTTEELEQKKISKFLKIKKR